MTQISGTTDHTHHPNMPERALAVRALTRNLAKPIPGLRRPAIRLGSSLLKKTCECGRSQLVPALPLAHCPDCHHTWKSRNGGAAPKKCSACEFDLQQWRIQMGVTPETAATIPRRSYKRKAAPAEAQASLLSA